MERKSRTILVRILILGIAVWGQRVSVAVAALENSPEVRDGIEKIADPAVREIAREVVEKIDRGDTKEIMEVERAEKEVMKIEDHPELAVRETPGAEQKEVAVKEVSEQKEVAAPEQKEVAVEQKEAPVAESKAEAAQQVAETKSNADAVAEDQCALDPDNFHHDPDTGTCVAN